MAFTTSTSPSEDIIVQEGTFAFDFDASGAVFKGQALYARGTVGACAPDSALTYAQPGCLGIAAYDQTHGNPVAVFGPGNICRGVISGTCTAGDYLVCGGTGKLQKPSAWTLPVHNPSGVSFIALETVATADNSVRVMVF